MRYYLAVQCLEQKLVRPGRRYHHVILFIKDIRREWNIFTVISLIFMIADCPWTVSKSAKTTSPDEGRQLHW